MTDLCDEEGDAVDWDTARVQLSPLMEVSVRNSRVLRFYLFIDGECYGSFSYTTCKAMQSSLGAIGLAKKLPKFPTKKTVLSEAKRHGGRVDVLQEWLEVVIQSPTVRESGPVTSFLTGLAPVTNTAGSLALESKLQRPGTPDEALTSTHPATVARSTSLQDVTSDAATGGRRGSARSGILHRFSSTSASTKKKGGGNRSGTMMTTRDGGGDGSASGVRGSVLIAPMPPPGLESRASEPELQTVRHGASMGVPKAHRRARSDGQVAHPSDHVNRRESGLYALDEAYDIPPDELECVTVKGDQLNAAHCTVPAVWPWVGRLYAATVTKVDVSHGAFHDLSALSAFVCLESLVVDYNPLGDADLPNLPSLPGLKTLSLNHNKIHSLLAFVGFANVKYPGLTFISLLGNPCCPSPVSGGTEEAYTTYRQQLVLSLTQLGWIDSTSTALDRTDQHGQMSCHGLNAVVIPSWVNEAKSTALGLDFSAGQLADMSSLCTFPFLQTLVLDHNQLESIKSLPELPTLRALSLNNNELKDLHATLISIQRKCGNITFLSLLGNPCYPCELSSATYQAQRIYERHRAQVVMALPQLQYLDFRATDTEVPLVPEWLCLDTPAAVGAEIVRDGADGQFLITSFANQYMLIVNVMGDVASYNIATGRRGVGFMLAGRKFHTLESMVEHLHRVPLEDASGQRIQLSTPVQLPATRHPGAVQVQSSTTTHVSVTGTLTPTRSSLVESSPLVRVPWDSPSPPSLASPDLMSDDGGGSVHEGEGEGGGGVSGQAGLPGTGDGGEHRQNASELTAVGSVRSRGSSRRSKTSEKVPKPYEWSIMDEAYPASFDTMQSALFGPSLDWWYDYYREKNFKNVVCTSWKSKHRELNYTIPKNGLNPQVVVHERHSIVLDTDTSFCVQVVSRTPGVPYGSSFQTLVQYYMRVEGSSTTHFRVTAEVEWRKSCMLKSTISKKIETNLMKSFAHIKKHVDTTIGPGAASS
eukprot:m.208375 g.208375  ORF g.208375 m.208375 type:complete len:984 (-) comp24124_c0_seq1:34-2985(-)